MKNLILIFLVIGVTIIFSGCSKDNSYAPDLNQNDQETVFLKAQKIPFVGVSNFVAPGEDGIIKVLPNGNTLIKGQTVVWYDEGDDPRVTGISNWTANWLITGENTAKLWGKCEILVGVTDPNDLSPLTGIWELSWHGYQSPTPGGFIIVAEANGTGKSGEVKGMVGKWTYTMDIEQGFFYAVEGYIK